MREDSGYGPPAGPPDMEGSIFVDNGPPLEKLPPMGQPARIAAAKPPAGTIQLVGGEALAKSQRTAPAAAAPESQENTAGDRSAPTATAAPGRARVARRPSVASRAKGTASPAESQSATSKDRSR